MTRSTNRFVWYSTLLMPMLAPMTAQTAPAGTVRQSVTPLPQDHDLYAATHDGCELRRGRRQHHCRQQGCRHELVDGIPWRGIVFTRRRLGRRLDPHQSGRTALDRTSLQDAAYAPRPDPGRYTMGRHGAHQCRWKTLDSPNLRVLADVVLRHLGRHPLRRRRLARSDPGERRRPPCHEAARVPARASPSRNTACALCHFLDSCASSQSSKMSTDVSRWSWSARPETCSETGVPGTASRKSPWPMGWRQESCHARSPSAGLETRHRWAD